MKLAPPSQPEPVVRHIGMHLQGTARTDARVLREAAALVRAGYAVTIVDTDSDVTRPRVETLDGVTLSHIPKIRRRILPGKLGAAINVWRQYPVRIRTLLALRADAYHAHDTNTLLATYIAGRIRRKPIVFDSHELPYVQRYIVARPVQRWFYVALLRRMMPRVSAVITVSTPIIDEIQQRYGGPRAVLVRNIPLYQPPLASDRLREWLHLPPETRIVLYQGGLQENRSLDVLVRAARYLPADIVIVMLGDGTSKAGLEALIATEGVAERVRLIPAVPYDELLTWTASADLGLTLFSPDISPSIYYCLPNKLFEYLMAGVPVLTSQLPAVAEVLERYDVGHVCPSMEPEAVAQAIVEMLADREGMARMRRRAMEATAGELRWENEQAHLVGLYHRLLGANSDDTASALPDAASLIGN